ncbi:MAG: tRNA(Ile)-lysidine synthase [Candidatus Midichloriaceae bacterium]|jgi:tRNA(Ile)-lysidine synthase|nr:tRNA(Ile)-lysidine synthase [Candidatus Midichloriaceae bacterium]
MLNFQTIDDLLKQKPKKVAIAVSGGADSMCLTHLLAGWCKKNNVELHALIVDHKLRTESSDESASVKSFLISEGINTYILEWKDAKPKSDIQNQARIARYNLLTQHCKQYGIKHLFVAHTLNDQAETVLMRIIRGSGVDGISGMAPKSTYGYITLLRPLLKIDRKQIEEHLLNVGWSWVNDPSNLNHKYDRIKVRFILNSYAKEFNNQLIYNRLSLLAQNARATKNYLTKRVDIAWKKYVRIKELNYLEIDNSVHNLPQEIKKRLFVRAFKYLNPKATSPRLASLTNTIKELKTSANLTKTLMDCLLQKNIKNTTICLELGKNPLALDLKINEVNLWHNLKITVYKQGLVAKPLGKSGWEYLKGLGLTKPAKTPIAAIHSLLSIFDGDTLVSAPQINFSSPNISVDISMN